MKPQNTQCKLLQRYLGLQGMDKAQVIHEPCHKARVLVVEEPTPREKRPSSICEMYNKSGI